MPEPIHKRDPLEGVTEHAARDALNHLATFRHPGLQELRAKHGEQPLPAVVAYREALAVYGRPFKHTARGGRAYWPTIEGNEMRRRPLFGAPPPGKRKKRRTGHMPMAG